MSSGLCCPFGGQPAWRRILTVEGVEVSAVERLCAIGSAVCETLGVMNRHVVQLHVRSLETAAAKNSLVRK